MESVPWVENAGGECPLGGEACPLGGECMEGTSNVVFIRNIPKKLEIIYCIHPTRKDRQGFIPDLQILNPDPPHTVQWLQ